MAFDSDQQRTVLFGGAASSGATGDTWQWDGPAWTQVEDTGPPVRELHGMVYAADRKRTVLFGGEGGSGTRLSDTWEWDSSHWTHEQDIGPAREGLALAFTGSATALFGGLSGAQADAATVAGDTWEWDGSHWVERQDMGPQARWLHAMVFDSARNRLVLFGGTPSLVRDTQLGDTWEATDPGTGPGPDSGVVLSALNVQWDPASHLLTGQLNLSGHAPPQGLQVQLLVDNGAIGDLIFSYVDPSDPMESGWTLPVPPPWSVPFPAGTDHVPFKSPGTLSGLGALTFTATLGSVTKTASVNVNVP
jgi:hypothetical protein